MILKSMVLTCHTFDEIFPSSLPAQKYGNAGDYFQYLMRQIRRAHHFTLILRGLVIVTIDNKSIQE